MSVNNDPATDPQEPLLGGPWFLRGCENCKHYFSIDPDQGICKNAARSDAVPDREDVPCYVAAWWRFDCLQRVE